MEYQIFSIILLLLWPLYSMARVNSSTRHWTKPKPKVTWSSISAKRSQEKLAPRLSASNWGSAPARRIFTLRRRAELSCTGDCDAAPPLQWSLLKCWCYDHGVNDWHYGSPLFFNICCNSCTGIGYGSKSYNIKSSLSNEEANSCFIVFILTNKSPQIGQVPQKMHIVLIIQTLIWHAYTIWEL